MTKTKKKIRKTTNAPPICITSDKHLHHAGPLELPSNRHQNSLKISCMLRRSDSHSVKVSFSNILRGTMQTLQGGDTAC